MAKTDTNIAQAPSKALLGIGLVWLAVFIYASSNSIVSLLADIGRQHPVMGRNAVSLCNLLFLGSLISLVPMVFMFHKDWTRDNLRKLSRKDWGVLTLSAFLSSALTPALFFIALDYTTVTNVVLIGRIEPPLFLLATFFVLKEPLDPWAFGAGVIALLGAIVMIAMNGSDAAFTFGKGEIATVFATISFIASTIVTPGGSEKCPAGHLFNLPHGAGHDHLLFSGALPLWPKPLPGSVYRRAVEMGLGLRDHRDHHRAVRLEHRFEKCPRRGRFPRDLFLSGRSPDHRYGPAGRRSRPRPDPRRFDHSGGHRSRPVRPNSRRTSAKAA